MDKFVLIDGNSLLNRAYYATPVFTAKDGFPTNGIFGFVKLLLKIISDKKPSYLAVAFDLHAPTFRHEMYADYKAGRKPMPEDLVVQVPVLKEVLSLMKIRICELAGYEADDVIGTLARKFGVQTYIYTGDRDSYQLVDENTSVCYTRKGVSDILELSAENFQSEVGLNPAQIIDLKALMGDKSDNIPGVPGVGEKSAMQLLADYGNLDEIYAHLGEIKGALGKKLTDNKESAYFSRKLATIDTDVPVGIQLSECVLRMPFPHAVREKFAELDFRSLTSLPIFDETEQPRQPEKEEPIEEIFPASEEEAEKIYAESSCDAIAVFWDDKSFQICPDDGTDREFIFPVRENLLDVGFFLHSLFPALRTVFTGGKRVLLYNSKEIRHRLHDLGIAFTAPFEDVSLEKYIAEGMSNSDSLEFCLDSHSLPSRCKAHGILRLWNTFGEMLDDAERKLYFEIEKPLSVLLFEMELSGVSIDRGALEEFSVRYGTELKELTQKIYALAGETFNLNSPVQLGKILFEKLRIGSGSKSKGKRNYSTTAEVLEKYADDYEIVRLLLRYRQIQKLNSTYVEGFRPLIGSDGKVHTTYNQMNTSTGRLSSANPNLQNIPVRNDEGKELRKLFIASPGNVLIDADYSQIELRLLAHFSGCKELIEAYREHRDIHAITASQVFGVPLDKVTPQMRRSAKAVNFGIIYGISSFGLAKDLGISAKRAGEYIDKYFQTYSDVKKYMDENVERAKREGYITTLCGRRRVINELKSSNYNVRSFGERAAMNMPLQGSSADIIKIAMINVRKKLSEAGLHARLVLQVHDELVLDCPEGEKDAASEILQREMENAVSLKVPLTVEIACGKSWFSAK
ncbi:MAG TPA: DNA polymerase I [Candidatus Scatosoma pullicola]|nr:DNA polymerase I [Candidatus Scatosoma pullicola]